MTDERLRVESGPPDHVIAEASGDAVPAQATPTNDAAPAKEQAREVAGQAKEQAQAVAGQAKEHAQAAASQAKDKAAAQVDERSTQAGQQISAQGESLGGVAEELRRQGKDGPANVAEQASERVKAVGDYLERADGESLIQSAQDVARENPAAAAAVGAAAGFVAGRVIKASGADDPSPDDEPREPLP
jgi:F0F1-type ATP synthase membrane subunit b/b'